jgi:predicted O-linked N-acetylglucosamine transferase (SPINDLY family)
MLRTGATDVPLAPPARQRPKIVVVCEHFHSAHSVFRTHSRAVRSLKERFDVTGLAHVAALDQPARDCFHEVIDYPDGSATEGAAQCAAQIAELRPDIVFHLGVGMTDKSLALASLRLAPVQCVSYGHTATTMSPVIDYMILPDDFVGAEDLYSEKLLRFPPESIPYAPPAATEPPPPPRPERTGQGPVRIAVPASIMKINGPFLQALAAAESQAAHPVEFHFFPLGAVGLAFHHLEREVKRFLPGATVYPQSPRETYLERLGACDFFVSPFPYGNMNSIVDAIVMGVPGVCLDGEEAHAHADAAIFRRLGLPEELIAQAVPDYVAAIVRLVATPAWRRECQRIAEEIDLEQTAYAGDESLFCAQMLKLLPVAVSG